MVLTAVYIYIAVAARNFSVQWQDRHMYAHVHVIMNCNRPPDHWCGPYSASLVMACICVCAYNMQFASAHNLKATKLHKIASDLCMVIRSTWNTVSLSNATVTVICTLVGLANIKKF